MRTKAVIAGVIGGVVLVCFAILVMLMIWLGFRTGLAAGLAVAAAILLLYGLVFVPWATRWGATDAEAVEPLPGDDLIPGGDTVTRAITIAAPPERVWPWLVQLGWGRAGWYSYDWLDNDGRPSADRIIPSLQTLRPGDIIPMIPGWGPRVVAVEPGELIVSGGADAGIAGCYLLRPDGHGGTRMISRWRVRRSRNVLVLALMVFVTCGSFLLERKMLLNVKARAERHPEPAARR